MLHLGSVLLRVASESVLPPKKERWPGRGERALLEASPVGCAEGEPGGSDSKETPYCRNPGWDTHTCGTVLVSPSDRISG